MIYDADDDEYYEDDEYDDWTPSRWNCCELCGCCCDEDAGCNADDYWEHYDE